MSNYQKERLLRRLQAYARKELASPVSEALRKAVDKELYLSETKDNICFNCEHYWAEDLNGNPQNWCCFSNTSSADDETCDDFKRY